MTAAVVELTNWIGTRADGVLDWELTIRNISVAERMLDEAIRV
jgi:hypothetical protein